MALLSFTSQQAGAPARDGLEPVSSLVVSLVSHGHGILVKRLLQQIAEMCSNSVTRVVLTLNLPESVPLDCNWPFVLDVRRNSRPRGFGANHNSALEDATESFVCVLNPDVVLLGDPFGGLIASAHQFAVDGGLTLSYPLQVDAVGRIQHSERALPSPWALFLRRFLGRTELKVEWVNAACVVLPLTTWRHLQGFDEAYHMYCDDVDFSLRLRLAGGRLVKAPVQVLHAGERASSHNWRHLCWHVSSLLRLWRSPVYRCARNLVTVTDTEARTIAGP